jgi:protein-disulfide isomerase
MKELTTKKILDNRKKNKRILIGIALLLIFIGIFITIEQNKKTDLTPYLYAEHASEYGNKNAKVTIVEFFDPACEACRSFYPLVKQQIKQYSGKVKLVARPVAFHRNVDQVVAALEASKMQNKFWDALHVVFYYQSSWAINHVADVNLIYPYLQDIGVDIDKLKVDMKSQTVTDIMQKDAQDAKTLRVLKTPTFFVNGQVLEKFGAEPFKTLIAEQVKLAYAED